MAKLFKDVTEVMTKVSEGDLTARMDENGKRNKLQKISNKAIENIANMTRELKNQVINLSKEVSTLKEEIERTKETSDQVADAASQVATAATDQAINYRTFHRTWRTQERPLKKSTMQQLMR